MNKSGHVLLSAGIVATLRAPKAKHILEGRKRKTKTKHTNKTTTKHTNINLESAQGQVVAYESGLSNNEALQDNIHTKHKATWKNNYFDSIALNGSKRAYFGPMRNLTKMTATKP